ncbi:hypothetical protein, partial [Terriglobus sp. ADX1]|uniref:hypothetical protein n=1 Tax=Terriglobus sp. ADX1 TaxID=2794063 RepID=UPI002FE5CED4
LVSGNRFSTDVKMPVAFVRRASFVSSEVEWAEANAGSSASLRFAQDDALCAFELRCIST